MNLLLKNVEIINKSSPYHGKRVNVHIQNGHIASISEQNEPDADTIIEAAGWLLTIGWFDMRANFSDPGYEYKEDLITGSNAAAAGGFTEVALLPNTFPSIQTKNQIGYIKSKSKQLLTQLHPIASVTVDNKGEELTEMIDLYEAGAVAFSDGEKGLWHTDICLKTLQYLQKFDGLLMDKPGDKLLSALGTMNESIHSTMLGLKGLPALAEELSVIRNINLLAYAGGKMHISNISSGRSVALIREAKASGLDLTCDIAAHQLAFDDSSFYDFNTNFKVNPPFRSQQDIKALFEGLRDNTIDIIVSSHSPQDEESKKLEFDAAEFGIIALQTVLPLLVQYQKEILLEDAIEKVTVVPRKRLALEVPEIRPGHEANLTLLDPNAEWVFEDSTNKSKARNSPFYKQKMTGKVMGVFNQGKFLLEDSLKIHR